MAERLHFDRFTLDTGTRELLEDGAIVHLPPKAFDLLELLVRKRPEAVPRAEIEKRIWRSTHVSDSSLAGLVGELRKALGDQGRPARFVRTVHSFGYAFCATASAVGAPAARAQSSVAAYRHVGTGGSRCPERREIAARVPARSLFRVRRGDRAAQRQDEPGLIVRK